jgi:hypothetical protein
MQEKQWKGGIVQGLKCQMILMGLLLSIFQGLGQAETITFDGSWGVPGFQLVSQRDSQVEIVYSMGSLRIEEVDIDGENMQTLAIPGTFLPNDEGAPYLPGTGRYLALPQEAVARLEVVETRRQTFSNMNIIPAPPIPLEGDDSPVAYVKDATIYESDESYPAEPFMLSAPLKIRGVDAVIVGITPFQYHPLSKELVVYTDVRIRVHFEGGNGRFGQDRYRSRHWEPVLRAHLLNYESLPEVDFGGRGATKDTDHKDIGCEYVIIVPDDPDFIAWADSIKHWRTLQGISTEVFTLTQTGPSTAQIESFIDNAYTTWDIPPAAVLLLSDYPSSGKTYGIGSPVWDNYCVSDNIYSDVDGDDLPEINFARITAQDAADLEQMITKFLDYERSPYTDAGFYDHPVVAGGWQTERWFIICSEIIYGFLADVLGKDPVREYAIYSGTPGSIWSTNVNTYMLVDYFGPGGLGYIPADPSHLTDWGGNATRLNNDINSGCFIVQHRDHGGVDGWGEPSYHNSDLAGLSNTMLPFVFSINCLTGKYNSSSECFVERFHRMQHGALGLIGASETSYSFVNDTYVFGIYDCLWPQFDPGYPVTAKNFGPENLRPGFAQASGKYYLQASSWPYNPDYKEVTYHLFHTHGDAFTTLYSEVPQSLTVTHPSALLIGVDFFPVTADEGAVIALTVDGEIVGTADGTGGVVNVPIVAQTTPGTLLVTVTKYNHYRYSQEVEIIPPEGPYVIYDSHDIDDDSGNANGVVNPGELIDLSVTLRNVGVEMAVDVAAELSTDDAFVSVGDSVQGFGDIDSAATATSLGDFTFQVDLNCPDDHTILFDLAVTAVDTFSWNSSFTVKVRAPDIATSSDTLQFGEVYIGYPETLPLTILNTGSDTLHVSDIFSSHADFSVDITAFSLAGGENQEVTVSFGPISVGAADGILSIISNDPDQGIATVGLIGTGLVAPEILVRPDSLSDSLYTGDTSIHTLMLHNQGGSDLNFEIEIVDPGALMLIGGPDEEGGLSKGPLAGDIIEDFDGAGAWPWSPWVSVESGGSVTTACAHDGPQGISDPGWYYRTDVTYGSPGDGLRIWVKPGSGRFYMGFGATASGAWSLVAAPNTTELIIQQNSGYGYSDLSSVSQSWVTGQWYLLEAVFEEGGLVVGNLYDEDGTTLINTVSATLSGFAPAGVAIRSFSQFCGDSFSSGALLAWLSADPTTGTVPAGDSLSIEVTFDAVGLNGGDYLNDIVITSNDPDEPETLVPAFLHVTGAPGMVVSDDTLDYGEVFVGAAVPETLLISNEGTDLLTVTDIYTDHSAYSPDITSFSLNPDESQEVVVTFLPPGVGSYPGTLTIESNDPDPVITVVLLGEGANPPVISVSPDSLSDSLYTGDTSTHWLTITNTGESDLIFNSSVEEAIMMKRSPRGRPRIHIPRFEGQLPSGKGNHSTGLAPSALAEGNFPDGPLQPTGITAYGSGYDFGTSTEYYASFDLGVPEEVSYFNPTGGFIPGGDFAGQGDQAFYYAVDADYNQLFTVDTTSGAANMVGPMTTAYGENWSGMAGDPVTGNMYASATNISNSYLYTVNLGTGAATLVGEITGAPGIIAIAVDDVGQMYGLDIVNDVLLSIDKNTGAGTVIGSIGFNANYSQGMEYDSNSGLLYLAAYNSTAGQGELRIADPSTGSSTLVGVFGSIVPGTGTEISCMAVPAGGTSWLIVEPASGIVPPDSSIDIEVTFDATGLFGGDYFADIILANNDPLNPEVWVPAHLHVTGAPNIAVSDTLLDYGSVFIGAAPEETLLVSNAGTDLLTVTDISSDHGDYSVDLTTFSLDPGEDQPILVTFTPSSTGPITATLTITSDDPDDPIVEVDLTGEGLIAPDISVVPDSLYQQLMTGEVDSSQVITISNEGGSDLDFEISIEEIIVAFLKNRTSVHEDQRSRQSVTSASPVGRMLHRIDASGFSKGFRPKGFRPEVHGGDENGSDTPQPMFPSVEGAGDVIRTIPAPGNVLGMTYLNESLWVVVATSPQQIMELNPADGSVRSSFHIGSDFHLGLANDGTGLWVCNFSNGTLEEYSTGGALITSWIAPMGVDVRGVAWDGSALWVGGGDHGTLYRMDTAGNILDTRALSTSLIGWIMDMEWVSQHPQGQLWMNDDSNLDVNQLDAWSEPPVLIQDFAHPDPGSIIEGIAHDGENLWLSGFYSTFIYLVDDGIEEMNWISVEPTSGTIAAGDSMDVMVTFDATDKMGGDYFADVVVTSNDPDEPEVRVAAHLNVVGVPRIAVSDSVLDYGSVFIGYSAADTIVVSNVGSDLLTVSHITCDHPDYVPDPTSFTLNPGEQQDVVVTFSPVSVGMSIGTLTIDSDDPILPSVTVELTGQGLIPPDISVMPDSLYRSLYTDEIDSSGVITIANEGGSDLFFDISVEPSGALKAGRLEHNGPQDAERAWRHRTVPNATDELLPGGDRTFSERIFDDAPSIGETTKSDAPDDGYIEETFGSWYSTWSGGLRDRGNVFYVTTSTTLREVRFYLDITVSTQMYFVVYQGSSLEGSYDLVEQIYIGDSGTGTGWYSSGAMSVDLVAGYYYYIGTSWEGEATYGRGTEVVPLPTSFGTLQTGVPATQAGFPPAGTLTQTYSGFSPYYQTIVTGLGVDWLVIDPDSGMVPSGSSVDLQVTFDATDLESDDYLADVLIASNDPDQPEVSLPAHLHVIGVPRIALSDTLLDFGVCYLGYTYSQWLEVINEGTDLLTVSNISSDHGDYTVDLTGFDLPPGESQLVEVTFAPSDSGSICGTLEIENNDPLLPTATVDLRGEASIPPIISLSSHSFGDTLFTNTTATHWLTISNSGGSDLDYDILIEDAPPTLKAGLGSGMAKQIRDPMAAKERGHPPDPADRKDADDDLDILLLSTGGDPWEIRYALLGFPDISVVDVYNAVSTTPVLGDLLDYHCVIVVNNDVFGDPVAVGNVLADYVDAGGGLILTLASFAAGYEVQGRLLDEGYMPFTLATDYGETANLGSFNADHPIMEGVTSALSYLLMDVNLTFGTEWVADWENGLPAVATKGIHVAAVNLFVGDYGYWTGDVPLILRNAAAWSCRPIGWLSAVPSSGTVPADSSMDIALIFDAHDLPVGDYFESLLIQSNDPVTPEDTATAHLLVRELPRLATSADTLGFGLVTPGMAVKKSLVVSNVGEDLLEIYGVSFEQGNCFSSQLETIILKPGESVSIEVVFFTNQARTQFIDEMTIYSNDPMQNQYPVLLTASCDLAPPDKIDDLSIGLAKGHVHLWWTEPQADVGIARYIIYRSPSVGSLGDSLAGTVQAVYTDMGGAGEGPGSYFYRVIAVDKAGRTSEPSNNVGEFSRSLSSDSVVK